MKVYINEGAIFGAVFRNSRKCMKLMFLAVGRSKLTIKTNFLRNYVIN